MAKLSYIGTLALASTCIAGCAEGIFKMRSESWKTPERWQAVQARPFYSMTRDELFAGNCDPLATNLACFSEMIQYVQRVPREQKDGSFCFPLNLLMPRFPGKGVNSVGGDKPFFVNLLPRSTVVPKAYFHPERFRHDQAAYSEWRARNPGFRGFLSCEWTVDSIQNNLFLGGVKTMKIPTNELPRVYADRKEAFARGREFMTDVRLKKAFDTMVRFCFDDPKAMWVGEGMWCTGHLAAYWGAGGLGIETSRNNVYWQIQMMFCRGAARQFAIPWYWYVASFHREQGNLTAEMRGRESGPMFGISPSAVKRATYMTWLSGAASYQREADNHTHFLTKPLRLSDEGKMYRDFYELTRREDRGVPYTPVALLVPYTRGYCRYGGRAYLHFEYTEGDAMLDAVMSAALGFHANAARLKADKDYEYVMGNTPYGDMFDVLAADFPDQSSLRASLGDYPRAVLVGDYKDNPELERTLADYVAAGGVLTLNRAQVDGGFGKSLVGKPGVEVCEDRWLLPKWPIGAFELADGLVEAPAAARMLAHVTDGLAPVKVEGDVQYGFNRTKRGWLVYIINNAGVSKPKADYAKVMPGGTKVGVSLGRLAGATVRDMVANQSLSTTGGRLDLVVPYGELVILDIQE